MNILLVEDDLELGNGIRIALQDQAMQVVWVRRLSEAQRQMEDLAFDVVLLDQGLPDGDGIELLTRLRRERQTTPVLILTARDALDDRLHGLDSGADDYLVKPFALAELLSRVRALARRSFGMVGETLEVRGLAMHLPTMRVTVADGDVELSPSEFELLGFLLRRLDRVVTRHTLEEQVLRGGSENVSNVLDVHMSNLRRKIGEGYIRTVRGVGYVVDRQPPKRGARP
jgi:two-component system response regulator QseB